MYKYLNWRRFLIYIFTYVASGNNNWGNDIPSSVNCLKMIDGNDNLKASKDLLWDVFNLGKKSEPFSWEMLSRECFNDLELYKQRLNLTLDTCSSKNLNDKSVENLLTLFNCFNLQKSLDSTQSITKLKVAVLTWNYGCISKLIEDKINVIDVDSQEIYKHLLDIIQVVIIWIELFFICSMDPIKKSSIKLELQKIEKLCDFKLNSLMLNLDGLEESTIEDIKWYNDYIVNLVTYCETTLFSWFSTDPYQSKAEVKEIYQIEKNKLKDVGDFFKSVQNNQEVSGVLELSQDKFDRNYVFLDTYLDLLYLKFQERTFYNVDCQNDKKHFNIDDTYKDQQKAIIVLLHSYTQVAGYDNWDERVIEISDKINLLQSVWMVWIRNTNPKMAIENIDWVMFVVDAIFQDFLVNLENDHHAIWELFLVISSIVHFVTFKDEKKIQVFQNQINNIIETKKITGEWFYYQTWALCFGDVLLEIATDNKNMLKLMESLSVTDPLTWLSNRLQFDRDFTIDLINVIRNSNEDNLDSSNKWIFSLDIDFFKTINDKYGHDWWDIVLKEFANVVTSEIRATDRFYRVGWEEFMILCECNTQEDAFVFWEKILNAIEFKLSNILRQRQIFKSFSEEKITMSVWACNIVNKWWYSANNIPEFSSKCAKEVDEALYNSKKNGRNWITIAGKYVSRNNIEELILKPNISKYKTVV